MAKEDEIEVFTEYAETGDAGGSALCPCGEEFRWDLRPRQNMIDVPGRGALIKCPKCGRLEL